MTSRIPARCVLGLCLVLPLAACGSHPSVDATAARAGVSSTQAAEDRTSGGASGGGTTDAGGGATDAGGNGSGGGGNPGAPGADPADGGGAGGGAPQGNPGAPGDVAVFEEEGDAPYSALVDEAATKCADGACTLKEPPIILDGHVDRVEGGVGACTIAKKTDILYDPPAQGGRFPKGATVRAQVHCADVETPVEPANPGDGASAGNGATSDGATSDGATSDSTAPDSGSQPQG